MSRYTSRNRYPEVFRRSCLHIEMGHHGWYEFLLTMHERVPPHPSYRLRRVNRADRAFRVGVFFLRTAWNALQVESYPPQFSSTGLNEIIRCIHHGGIALGSLCYGLDPGAFRIDIASRPTYDFIPSIGPRRFRNVRKHAGQIIEIRGGDLE